MMRCRDPAPSKGGHPSACPVLGPSGRCARGFQRYAPACGPLSASLPPSAPAPPGRWPRPARPSGLRWGWPVGFPSARPAPPCRGRAVARRSARASARSPPRFAARCGAPCGSVPRAVPLAGPRPPPGRASRCRPPSCCGLGLAPFGPGRGPRGSSSRPGGGWGFPVAWRRSPPPLRPFGPWPRFLPPRRCGGAARRPFAPPRRGVWGLASGPGPFWLPPASARGGPSPPRSRLRQPPTQGQRGPCSLDTAARKKSRWLLPARGLNKTAYYFVQLPR